MENQQQPIQFNQDQDILSARQKRRVWVFALSGVIAVLLLCYVLWLFLAKGYQINVNPAEAQSSAQIRLKQGTGFVFSNKVYTFTGNTVVAVSASKFITQEVVINPESPAIIDVTLTPAPVELRFFVVGEDDAAEPEVQWRVNGALVASASTLQHQVKPGEISVNVSHPWYQTAIWQGSGGAADEITQTITLQPITGALNIASQPLGAEVIIDGELVGITPLTVDRVGGEYEVEIRHPGYQSISDQISVENRNLTPQRNYILIPEQGILQFQLSPSNGLLSVNSAPVTASQTSIDANVNHLVRYQKQGFIPQTQNLTLKPGETRAINFALKQEMARVSISSSLPSQVQINGKPAGQTPLELSLQTVEQEITFIKPGYRTVVQKLIPEAGIDNVVFAEILSEFDARRKEGKPLFISGLGIEMKKFRPRAYTMGSPDNEPYRRRNEHRISVDFSRHIWVAKHEVTEAQYSAFKQGGASSELPVTNITWLEAVAYCHWLSVQEGLEPFYLFENGRLVGLNPEARGYRLLTEAEWEWLAKMSNRRAPTQYSWGSTERIPKEYGNYADESAKATGKFTLQNYDDGYKLKAPVGSFKADRAGLFDLDGNVSEWVHDRFTLQPPDTRQTYRDYLGMSRGSANVIKGGNYESGRHRDLRVARRTQGNEGSDTVGFRIARYD